MSDLFKNLTPEAKAAVEAASGEAPIETTELTEAEKAAQSEPEEVDEEEELIVDEFTLLKSRAKLMGIKVGNMSLDTLRAKIQAALEGEAVQEEVEEVAAVATATVAATTNTTPVAKTEKQVAAEKKKSLRHTMKIEQMRLVRVLITNLDPRDKDLPGGIFTVANEYIGNVSKFVPYGEAGEIGYHVPWCIYEFMKDKVYQQIRTVKKNGKDTVETKTVKKFALEVLPPLTSAEINRLKASQLASGAIDK